MGHVDGAPMQDNRLNGTVTYADIISPITDTYAHDKFIPIDRMVQDQILVVGNDPTATDILRTDTPYMTGQSESGVRVHFYDTSDVKFQSGTAGTTLVGSIRLLVNLAGTTNAVDNSPYEAGELFFYIVMDENGSTQLTPGDLTISPGDFNSILDTTNGGPQPESAVLLPDDANKTESEDGV
jgi:hypothetical protein